MANGRYFGSGMMVAPLADPADGVLDLIVFRTKPRIGLSDIRLIYSGKHVDHPAVLTRRGATITVAPCDNLPVLTDADGEPVGTLPVSFTCRQGALSILC